MAIILVTSRSFSSGDVDLVTQAEAAGHRIVRGPSDHALGELAPLLAQADAWIAGTGSITPAHLDAAPKLKIIARYGVGTDAIDLSDAERRGVLVTNTPGANADAVADHTIGLMLAALRTIPAGDRRVRDGDWSVSRGRELGALTVGIVGFGRIGQGVARRLSGFSSRIIATDPFLSDEQVRTAGAEPVSLEQLFARADVVTLHAPGGNRLVDAPRLDAMRPASVLINAARGDLIDESAVVEALRTGKLAAFAADTLDGDTAASASPLLDPSLADSVIVTPHLGAQTTQAVDNMGAISLGEVLATLDGRAPRFPVSAAPRGTSRLKKADHMGFVGVSTSSSSIMRVFPRWAEILNLPTRTLIGHDLPIDATAEQYRSLVQHIRDDPHHRGALVTTHKMRLYASAADLFDELDPFARSCSEISSVAKAGERLLGRAKDPLTVRLALEEFLPADHFTRTGADVVIMGAGGSGTALSWALSERSDAPGRIVVTARSDAQLEHLREIHRQHGTDPEQIVYTRTDTSEQAAALVASAAPGSLIVNATGLGKDRPGSPLPDSVVFPRGAHVWEFNYRGSLEFLHQARAAETARGLHVVDGWRYFIHGWSQVIADVFDLSLTPDDIEQLAEAAEFARQ